MTLPSPPTRGSCGSRAEAVQGRVSDALTEDALRASYARLGRTVDDLPTPFYIAHRGGSLMVPEGTMEGYRVAAAMKAQALEADVQLLTDGTVGVMHDATVDRTTTSTGNVADHSAVSFGQLNIDASTYLGGGWPDNLRPAMVDAWLREFGNHIVLIPEAKSAGSVGPLCDLLDAHRIHPDRVIVQSFSAADCAVAAARGYLACFIGSTSVATATAIGAAWIAPHHTQITAGFVTEAHAAGLKVAAWTVNRRYRRDPLVAAGVDAIFSDDPAYLQDDTLLRTTDPFRSQAWYPGLQANGPSGCDRGKFYPDGSWGWDPAGASVNFALHGYLRPPDPSSFTMDLDLRIDGGSGGDPTRWASVLLTTADYPYADAPHESIDGYHLVIRQQGQLEIHRVPPGTSASLIGTFHSGSGTDLVLGAYTPYRITVTPRQITLARRDLTAETVTATDNAARGSFITLGRNQAGVRFREITLS